MNARKEKVRLILIMIVAFALAAASPGFAGPNSPSKKNPQITVSGQITYCHIFPDIGAEVKLFDHDTGTRIGCATANFLGYYTIKTNRIACQDGALFHTHTLKVKAASKLFVPAKAHRYLCVTLNCYKLHNLSLNANLAPFHGTHKWKEENWH